MSGRRPLLRVALLAASALLVVGAAALPFAADLLTTTSTADAPTADVSTTESLADEAVIVVAVAAAARLVARSLGRSRRARPLGRPSEPSPRLVELLASAATDVRRPHRRGPPPLPIVPT